MEEVKTEEVKIECNLNRIFYPKNVNYVESGEYAIFSADVIRALDDDTKETGLRYIGLTSVDNLINKKSFCGKIKIGNRVLIDKDELNKYLETLKC